jgi:hypothetical protein
MAKEKEAETSEADVQAARLKRIEEAAARLKEENEKFEANQVLLEAQRIEKMLAGKAEVGIPKKEETPQEYKDRIMRGEIK